MREKGQYNIKAGQFFDDVREQSARTIVDGLNIEPAAAEQVANEIAHRLSGQWGGSMIYITKHNPWQAHQRDLAIAAEFDGQNHTDLARRYGLSVPYIYEVLARLRKQRQPSLF